MHIMAFFNKEHIFIHNFLYKQMAKSDGRGLGYGPPCDKLQGQISRTAANNRVC